MGGVRDHWPNLTVYAFSTSLISRLSISRGMTLQMPRHEGRHERSLITVSQGNKLFLALWSNSMEEMGTRPMTLGFDFI